MNRYSRICAALLAMLFATTANALEWGNVKGRVVFAEKNIPANVPVNVNKDKPHCLSKGAILRNQLVVNSTNKGVRWVLVWLTAVDDRLNAKAIPTHPAFAKMAPQVVIDQPCCVFEPRMIGMREGQELVVKNSSPIAHNFAVSGGLAGPNINVLIPSQGLHTEKGIKARLIPLVYSCSIHAWMRGYIGVFKHPYFAVTDADGNFTFENAPAGKYRLMAWHEQIGWVIINEKNLKDRGKVIDIKSGGTDVGKISLILPRD